MENQGKRLVLAVVLALAVMLGWNLFFPSKEDPQPTPAAGSAAKAPLAAPGATPAAAPVPGAPASAQPAELPDAPRPPEEKLALAFEKFEATFSSYGGALKSWRLADPRFRKEGEATKGELLPNRNDAGAFLVCVMDSQCDLAHPAAWTGQKLSDTQVRYTLSGARYDFEKTFTLFPDDFVVKMQIKVTAKQDQAAPQRLAVVVYAHQDPAADHGGSSQVAARVWSSSTMRDGDIYHTPIKDVIASPRFEDNVLWTGFEHPYLLAAYAPRHSETERIEKITWAGPALGAGGGDLMRTDILFPSVQVKAGSQLTHEVVAFLGPKNYRELDRADASAGFPTQFSHTIDFGWFGIIGKPLLWLLHQFHSVVGNWGIAIILLTILVKLATLYWTTKSTRSMKGLAALAPQMKQLQEKYKDDRQRLQVETMALYKQHKVNPVAGCLPILLQMPIWLALYRMLSSAGELYQEGFIPGWINDLTNTDPFHILPIVVTLTMFIQARLQPATADSRQQKFLQYGMPLVFGVMSFVFPSGLSLYIFTNTLLSLLHSVYMNKYDKKSLEIAARAKANAEAAAAAAKPAAKPASSKPVAKGSSKDSIKNGKPAAPKPVIDVASSEASADDADSDDGSEADDADAPSSGAVGRPQGARAKRKKRRR